MDIAQVKRFVISFFLMVVVLGCGGSSNSSSPTTSNDNSNNNNSSTTTFRLMKPDWDYTLGSGNWVYTPAFHNGTLYVTSFYNLYAINTDGTLKWSFDATPFTAPSIAITNGVIYLTQRDGSLSAINENGNLLWKYASPRTNYAHTPTIGCNNTLYYSTSYAIYAIDLVNKDLKWKVNLDYTFGGSTIVDEACNIYTSTTKKIVAIDENGSIKWHYAIEDIQVDAPKFVMDNDDNLYIKTRTTLTTIDKNGEFLWSHKELKGYHPPIIDKNGIIYISDNRGIVYALDSDGSLKWKYEEAPKGQYDSGVFLTLGKDKLYVNTHHQLYALTLDGKLIRKDVHLADVRSSPILVNDKLYVGEGIYLKAYTIENGGYQNNAQWPVEYYNNQHTRTKIKEASQNQF